MRKKLLTVTFALLTGLVFAQEGEKSVPKKDLLPMSGDIGLGFDGAALIRTVGGLFWNNNNQDQASQRFGNRITAKYFLTDKSAVRASFGFNSEYSLTHNSVLDAKAQYDASFGTQDDINAALQYKVDDQWKRNLTGLNLSLGYEIRKGEKFIQGYFGGEAVFGMTIEKNEFTYGNAFSDIYDVEFTENDGTWSNTDVQTTTADMSRDLNEKSNSFTYGARGFIGVEVFFAPKISLGLEYGLGYYFTTTKNTVTTQETYYPNYTTGATVIEEAPVNTAQNDTRGTFVTDNNAARAINAAQSASVTLMIHF